MITTYSIWSPLPLEPLEEVYNLALNDCRDNITQGHGGIRPPKYNVYDRPVQLLWQSDLTGGGLNYSMLSIVLEALKRLHTDPGPPLRRIYRQMISYDVFEQRGVQRFELGEGHVQSVAEVSRRQSVNSLHRDNEYQIPFTPYKLLVTADSDYLMPITSLRETYSVVISALENEITQGRGSAKPEGFTFQEPPVELNWARLYREIGLNYTDLVRVFKALESIHMNRQTPWYSKVIRYHVVASNAGQGGLVAMGGGWVDDMLEMGPSNISVQNFKRHLVSPADPLVPPYEYHLPNTTYVLDVWAVVPSVGPELPLDGLIVVYDIALRRFTSEVQSGHGETVPSTVNIGVHRISLSWRRENPPGVNYVMLLEVYRLLETIQTSEGSSYPEGYRRNLLFQVVTMHGDRLGGGRVIG